MRTGLKTIIPRVFIIMAEPCAICNTSTNTDDRLSEDAAKQTKEKLDFFVCQEFSVRLGETNLASSTWLCHKCVHEIDDYFETLTIMNAKRDELLHKLQQVIVMTPQSDSTQTSSQTSCQKRPSATSSTGCTTPKRPRKCNESSLQVRLNLRYLM